MRICSLLPSATEIVFALGLDDDLVGVTHECDYPPEARRLPAVTASIIDHEGRSSGEIHRHISEAIHSGSSIYALDQAKLEQLDAGLILTQELCDVCAVSYGEVRRAVRLLPGERQLLSLEPTSLDTILETIRSVGEAAGAALKADALVAGLRRRIEAVVERARDVAARPRVFALEWLDPPFVGGHWVPEMVRLAGGVDRLGREGHPSVALSWDDVAAYDPDVIVMLPCGYHLDESLRELERNPLPEPWGRLKAVQAGEVYVVDGSAYFNRPGPRAVDGLEIMAEVLHPELFPRLKPLDAWVKLPLASST